MKEQMEKILEEKRLLPFWTVKDMADVPHMAQVLIETGVPVVEIALRSELAVEAIKEMKKIEGMYVGAGTVKTKEEAQKVIEAGADFIVSPGETEEIVDVCIENDMPVYPGVVTPSEVLEGYRKGLRCFKFFPAEAYGGIATLKALKGPFPNLKFLPTGGIDADNYKEYLALDNVWAVGGSFILPSGLIREKDWEGLRDHIRRLL